MRKEKFAVERPTRLIIGDPMYFEAIGNGMDKREKECTFIRKRMSKKVETTIVVREEEDSCEVGGKKHNYTSIIVNIIGTPDNLLQETKDRFIEIFTNNQYHPKLLKKDGQLGCDTASFVIETNLGIEEFHTGADGCYGHYLIYKDNLTYKIELSLNTNLFDFDQVVKTMKYLFQVV